MSARMFISLMLLLMVFTAGLFVFSSPAPKELHKKECPAGASCGDVKQTNTAADGIIWESVSRHLLSVVQ